MPLQNLLSRTHTKPLTERRQRIHDFLSQQYIGVLSTVAPNNNPHGAVMYYAIDDNFTIHLLTKTRTRKYDNLIHNNHVMLTVFEPDNQTTAQILGTAVEHSSGADVGLVSNMVFGKVMQDHHNQLPPIVKLQAGSFTTFSIEPVQIRMAVFSRPDPGDHRQLFESIESFDLNDTYA